MVSPTNEEELKNKDQQRQEDSSTLDSDQEDQDSSNPSKSEDEPSTFDVVMEAIGQDGEDEDEDSLDDDKSKSDEDDKKSEDEEDGSISDDEFEDFSPEERTQLKKATAERFDKLKGLYRESKDKVTDLSTQLEQATVEAGHYKQFVSFLDENRLSQDEANQLFHVGAMMKNDPIKALEIMTPYYNELLRATGNVLPRDLHEQVTQGYITKAHALELSRLRATGHTNRTISNEKQTHQHQREQRSSAENVASMQSAIVDWEKQWSSSDPDYSYKKDRVLDRVELLLVRAKKAGQLPKTVDEATNLANRAKSEIEADLKQFKPRKQIKTVDGGSSSTNLPEPKNTRDVMMRALNQ